MLLRGRDITSSRENYAGLWSRPVHAFPVALHFHLHYFSPHQPAEHSHGGEASQALCLIELTQETASQLSAHKTCPSEHKRSTSINLSLQIQRLRHTKGLASMSVRGSGAKPGFQYVVSGIWGSVYEEQSGDCTTGLEVSDCTQLPKRGKCLEGRAFLLGSFLGNQNLGPRHRFHRFQILC